MAMDLIVRSGNIMTCEEGRPIEPFDGYIAIAGGRIAALGQGEIPPELCRPAAKIINARGQTIIPGLIDAHTHLIHAGSRESELDLKLKGVSYLDILKSGGGILDTVARTRKATKEELKKQAQKSLDQMLLHGTTTIEAKSGYGLDLETEVKCLLAARELHEEHEVDIISTYLGAHAIPDEYAANPQGYIDLMTEQVMPFVSRYKLAEFMDVFCEEGVFSPRETRVLLETGRELGFKLKLHADEMVPLQGAELAAEMRATSADHLLAASAEGQDALVKAGVTAVLLPGTSFYLMLGRYAEARQMIDKGIRVALASDYNPGSCPCENLQAIMTMACFGMRLSPAEILQGMTINAAYALDRAADIGSIEVGKKADLAILDAPNWEYVVYHFGINHVDKVIKNGRIVVEKGNLV